MGVWQKGDCAFTLGLFRIHKMHNAEKVGKRTYWCMQATVNALFNMAFVHNDTLSLCGCCCKKHTGRHLSIS